MLSDVVGGANMGMVERGSVGALGARTDPGDRNRLPAQTGRILTAVEARIPRLGDFASLARADLRDDFVRANQRAGGLHSQAAGRVMRQPRRPAGRLIRARGPMKHTIGVPLALALLLLAPSMGRAAQDSRFEFRRERAEIRREWRQANRERYRVRAEIRREFRRARDAYRRAFRDASSRAYREAMRDTRRAFRDAHRWRW